MKNIKIVHVLPKESLALSDVYLSYMCQALQKGGDLLGRQVNTSIFSFENDTVSGNGSAQISHKIPADTLINMLKQVDVVYVHQCLSSASLYIAAHARLLGKCVIGSHYRGGENYLSTYPEIGELFDFFHADSAFAANTYKNLNGCVKVIKGPMNTEKYRPSLQKARNPRLVLAVGKILPHKGFDKIIEALPEELELKIAGTFDENTYREYLFSIIQNKTVKILDNQTDADVLDLMQTAGIFVHADTSFDYDNPELLDLPPLEALCIGLPSLVSDIGPLRELVHLPGCYVFDSTQGLSKLLKDHLQGKLPQYEPSTMYAGVVEHYGLKEFGYKMLIEIQRYL